MEMIVKTFAGLEGVLARELSGLGAREVDAGNRAVRCFGDRRLLYRINLECRTALRVLLPIARFKARNEAQLYREIKQLDWSKYLGLQDTFAIDAVTGGPLFSHSKYAALKTKDAIADQFRDRRGKRPDVDVTAPSLRINLHIKYDKCTLSLDSSGDSLHKRGYRKASVKAPINEVLAAGMLRLAGWPRPMPFLDPMCGSGTIPIEAALMAKNIPAQLPARPFGFQNWKDFDPRLWEEVVKQARRGIRKDWKFPIRGSDRDQEAIDAARTNARAAGVDRLIDWSRKGWEAQVPGQAGLLIMNPPYDERLAEDRAVEVYKSYGDLLKQRYAGWEAWIISAHKEALKHLGLRTSKRTTLFNGPLECKYLKYELYTGSRKVGKKED